MAHTCDNGIFYEVENGIFEFKECMQPSDYRYVHDDRPGFYFVRCIDCMYKAAASNYPDPETVDEYDFWLQSFLWNKIPNCPPEEKEQM